MRKDVAVLMVLWVMCIPYATFICASATPNKLDTLKAFLRKKILYDEYVPIDSIIGKTKCERYKKRNAIIRV